MRAPYDSTLSVYPGRDTMGHDILHLAVHLAMIKTPLFCRLYDRIGHGMREMFFQAGCHPEHLTFVFTAERHHFRNRRAGPGKGPCLVKDHGVGIADPFHEHTALYSDLMPAGFTHGRKHGKRHGELQRTGKVHHQD